MNIGVIKEALRVKLACEALDTDGGVRCAADVEE